MASSYTESAPNLTFQPGLPHHRPHDGRTAGVAPVGGEGGRRSRAGAPSAGHSDSHERMGSSPAQLAEPVCGAQPRRPHDGRTADVAPVGGEGGRRSRAGASSAGHSDSHERVGSSPAQLVEPVCGAESRRPHDGRASGVAPVGGEEDGRAEPELLRRALRLA